MNEGKVVLLVDDEPDLMTTLKKRLKLLHFEVMTASDGREALKLAADRKPDIILLDIMMPEMDGFEVCEKLKKDERFKSIPVIFLTCAAEIKYKTKGFDLGGADYITKPVDSRELTARVNAHLLMKQQEEEKLAARELEVVKDMIVTLNHQLNQYLTVIKGHTQLLLAETKEKDKSKYSRLKMILEGEKGIEEVINKISNITTVKEKTYVGDVKMLDIEDSQ